MMNNLYVCIVELVPDREWEWQILESDTDNIKRLQYYAISNFLSVISTFSSLINTIQIMLNIAETVLQATATGSEPIQKKSFIETMKASMIAVVNYIVAMILKPFQMIQNLFASKTANAPAEIKTVKAAVAKVATAVVAKVVKPVPTAGDIAAKKYALEKLKEIDQGSLIFDSIDDSVFTVFIYMYIITML